MLAEAEEPTGIGADDRQEPLFGAPDRLAGQHHDLLPVERLRGRAEAPDTIGRRCGATCSSPRHWTTVTLDRIDLSDIMGHMRMALRHCSVNPTNIVLISLVHILMPACAQVVYFDNFEQFAPGTSLTTVTYTPASGPPAATATTRVLNGSPTITASRLLGSTCAFFDNSAVTNKSEYRASPSQPLTDQVLEITWKMFIKSTNSGPGIFMVSVPTTDPVANYNPPLAFLDTGSVIALTNGPLPLEPVTVLGSWASFANTFMASRLILNYPERKLWFSLNAQPTASLPLGPYFSTLVDAFTFTAFERTQGSVGNQFALDDVKVEVRPLAPTILGIERSAASVAITFTTLPGSLYSVESCTNLLAPSWKSVATNLPGTANPVQVINSTTADGPACFYRAVKTQ